MNGTRNIGEDKDSHQEELERLLATVRDTRLQETDQVRVTRAIERLGELRDPAAVDDLVQLLTFRRVWPWEKDPTVPKSTEPVHPWTWNTFPAVKALSLIGQPALPALIRVIGTHEPDSPESQKAMEVIILMSGDKRSDYVARLKYAAAAASSPDAAQRLRQAAETLEHTKR
jgi:PBS lyase HEAT-like repeat